MGFFVNADDFGLTEGTNRCILQAYDRGVLHGASILANGAAFESAAREYRKRPGLVLSVHLNLIEGKPVSNPKSVPLLLNKSGELSWSFGKLVLRYYLAGPSTRRALRAQLRTELVAQIEKVKSILRPGAPLRVDSHMHLHLLPFVFRIVAEAATPQGIRYIRLPRETFFLFLGDAQSWRVYLGANLIKHFVLKLLSRQAFQICTAQGIETCDHFVGVLFTGKMTLGAASAALKNLSPSDNTEILFHPGTPDHHDRALWKDRSDLVEYYYDEWRQRELQTLLSPGFRALLDEDTDERLSRGG